MQALYFIDMIYNRARPWGHYMLQENPPADKWISSWILDPYDQDRKVLLWTLTFLFMKLNYQRRRRKKGKYLFTDVCPCSIQADLDLQVLQKVLQYNEKQQQQYFLLYHD
jgi:hypothetical protein